MSVRLTRLLNYQTLRLSFFTFYTPGDDDYFIKPSVSYDLGDGVWVETGATLVGGREEHTFFGQFEKNDNLYFLLRYAF